MVTLADQFKNIYFRPTPFGTAAQGIAAVVKFSARRVSDSEIRASLFKTPETCLVFRAPERIERILIFCQSLSSGFVAASHVIYTSVRSPLCVDMVREPSEGNEPAGQHRSSSAN